MPTVLRVEGFRYYFFAEEGNEPPHIHVRKGGGYAKFWLGPVALADHKDLTRAELRRAREIAMEHEELLQEKWGEFFGS